MALDGDRPLTRLLVALVCLLGLAGCGASTEAGHGTITSASSSSRPATGPSSSATTGLCPQPSFAAAVTCISTSLTKFWTAQLHRRVVLRVVLDPIQAELPSECRGVPDDRAYTCGDNLTVYFGRAQETLITKTLAGADRSAALAWVLGHEMGHIVQFTEHEPLIERPKLTAGQSRELEQQADCLSGVWFASVVRSGILTAARFRRDAGRLITLITDPKEAHSHGTPAQRVAAIQRGLAGRSAPACGLKVSG